MEAIVRNDQVELRRRLIRFAGELIDPTHPSYETARRVFTPTSTAGRR
jgi:hypothetical protein